MKKLTIASETLKIKKKLFNSSQKQDAYDDDWPVIKYSRRINHYFLLFSDSFPVEWVFSPPCSDFLDYLSLLRSYASSFSLYAYYSACLSASLLIFFSSSWLLSLTSKK